MTACPTETVNLAYLNGDLDRRETEAFEIHLQACPACRAELAGLKSIVSGFAAIPRPEAPDAFVEAAGKALARAALERKEARPEDHRSRTEEHPRGREKEAKKSVRIRRWFVPSFGALILVAAVIAAVLIPVRIPSEAISKLFRIPSDLPLSGSAREFLGKFLAFLPLLLVPSIVENIRFLVRRKGKRPTLGPRLFSI